MTQLNSQEIINKWLVETIIGLNLCPFAKQPYDTGQINIQISKANNLEDAFQCFIKEIELIASHEMTTTSLLAFKNIKIDYFDFNDFVGSLEETLEDNNLDHEFQLVCFHPEFVFEDTQSNDLANFVNRSPLPLIHILKRTDITNALSTTHAGENISLLNEKTIKSLSPTELQKYFWYLY